MWRSQLLCFLFFLIVLYNSTHRHVLIIHFLAVLGNTAWLTTLILSPPWVHSKILAMHGAHHIIAQTPILPWHKFMYSSKHSTISLPQLPQLNSCGNQGKQSESKQALQLINLGNGRAQYIFSYQVFVKTVILLAEYNRFSLSFLFSSSCQVS